MSKLFMGTQPPHLAMYLFPTPIPSPSILTNHSILRLSLLPKSLDAAHPGGPARSYIAPITVKLEL